MQSLASRRLASRVGARLVRLVRSLGVGAVASVTDWVALAALVEIAGLGPRVANVPALLAGGAVQFFGCRHLVFRAGDGSMRRQLAGFVVVELATLALNGLLFDVLVAMTAIPYALARPLGTFIVFVGFSYPLWHLVFRPQGAKEHEPAR